MEDRGFFMTWQAVSRQLTAMPSELYLVRLIHAQSGRAFPGERLWSAAQLVSAATIRFLRARNREGCDIYIYPYAGDQNAGYILVDLDVPQPMVLETMRPHGHAPCVVLQTSPGHLQAWFVSVPVRCYLRWRPLRASGWRMPMAATRRARIGAIWEDSPVSPIRSPRAALRADKLPGSDCCTPVRAWRHKPTPCCSRPKLPCNRGRWRPIPTPLFPATRLLFPTSPPRRPAPSTAACMQRWRIADRCPQPDWSIVDLWVARHLLSQGTPAPRVETILRLASPHFPRRHHRPDDYLHRTLARAAFPAPGGRAV